MQLRLRHALIALLFFYYLTIGMTFNGILSAEIRTFSAVLGILLFVVWAFMALRRGWRLIATPIDTAVLVWCAAIVLSLLANLDLWRRSAPAVFYVGLYIFVWYILWQLWANKIIDRDMLVNGLLFAGLIVLLVGILQVRQIAANNLSAFPVSLFGNTNSFGSFLILLLPISLSRAMRGRRINQGMMLVYAVLTGALILLSGSRGALIGGVAAFAAFLLIGSPARLVRDYLNHFSPTMRRAIMGVAAVTIFIVVAIAVIVVADSFNAPGRSIGLRTWIYDSALTVFRENPLFGRGLFTFGGELARLNSMPNYEPHSHAHNLILNVVSELGLVGVVALLLTAGLSIRALIQFWRTRQFDDLRAGATAAFIGYGVHHLFDTTSMMPAIALTALIVLLIMLLPNTASDSVQKQRSKRFTPMLAVLGFALVGVTVWSTVSYREYVSALSQAVQTGDYLTGANRLEALSQSDPNFALYYQQQGMLLAVTAWQQPDDTVTAAARDAFARYTELVPQYGVGWLNLAAMRMAAGDSSGAEAALDQALMLAPDLRGSLGGFDDSADPTRADWEFGMNIPYAQFLHQAFPRHFVPQIRLLAEFE